MIRCEALWPAHCRLDAERLKYGHQFNSSLYAKVKHRPVQLIKTELKILRYL